MILAIDLGNTNIVIGCIESRKILFNERVSTNRNSTDLEYAIQLKNIFEIHCIDKNDIDGAVISSVVPSVTLALKAAVRKLLKVEPITVGPGLKTGLSIKTDNPALLGADLVVDAVAGINFYQAPLIIIDMGTATTFSIVDGKHNYLGGLIIPGMRTSLDALTSHAAQLRNVELSAPKNIIGTNTSDCVKSGIMQYTAAGIDGLIDRIEGELGYKCTVVATGGLSGIVVPLCKKEIIYDNDLLLKGLMVIYNKNKKIT